VRRSALLAVSIVAGTALQLARQRGLPATATVWAEDGSVLWGGAYGAGIRSLFRGYAGYAIAGPRALILALSWVHPKDIAWVTASLAAGIVTLLAIHVWYATAWFLNDGWRRAAAAAFVVLLPAALFEVTASLVNIQWYLMVNATLVLLEPHTTGRRTWFDGAIAVVAPISAPLTLFLAPAALLALAVRRERQRWVPALFLVAVAAQLVAVSQTESTASGSGSVWEAAKLFVPRVIGRLSLGEPLFDELYGAMPAGVLVVSMVLTVVLFGRSLLLLRQGSATPALLLTAAVVFWMVPVVLRGTEGFSVVNRHSQRYAVPAIALCLLAALAPGRGGSGRTTRLQLAMVVVWALVIVVPSTRGENYRSSGTTWRAELTREAGACKAGATYVEVGISPSPETKTWVLRVPCSRLSVTAASRSPAIGLVEACGPTWQPAWTPSAGGRCAGRTSPPVTR